jgi:hypothetical protein
VNVDHDDDGLDKENKSPVLNASSQKVTSCEYVCRGDNPGDFVAGEEKAAVNGPG